MPIHIQNDSLDDLQPITFISENFCDTVHLHSTCWRTFCHLYMLVKRLSLYLKDAESTKMCDHMALSKFFRRQVYKQHKKFEHAWNHINKNPAMANDTISRKKRAISQQFITFCLAKQKAWISNDCKRMLVFHMLNKNYSSH